MNEEPQEQQNQPPVAETNLDQPAATTPPVANEPAPAAAAAVPEAKPEQSSTVVLVWQWLTYGLWSWTLASLGILLSSTLAYFISSDARDGNYTWLIYIIATALCLLPISFVIDRVYSKHEPHHKHGFAAVILVLHAVLAFLVGIGSLITAVVTLLSLATDASGASSVKLTIIVSALLIAILSALFFVRIVRPPKLEILSRKFGLIVSVVAAVTIIAALAGPYVAAIQSKSDRQIESGLYGINSAIQDYTRDHKKLPSSLDDVTFSSYENASKDLAKSGRVTYNPKGQQASTSSFSRTYGYELCVTYKKTKGSGRVPSSASSSYSSSYLDTYSHPAGHTCYQQSAYVSGSASDFIKPSTLTN